MRWLLVIAIVALPACDPPIRAPRSPTVMIVESPGPLIRSHAALACTTCHLADSPVIAAGACESCHSAVVERAVATRGLHAKPLVRGQECADCHRDHRGASFNTRWGFFGSDVERFDHTYAGWKLGKGHRIACVRCHPNATAAVPTFTGATAACVSCHAPPHAGTPHAKHACETCHVADNWKTLSFDHSEKTRFDIGASHRQIACASCHTPQLGASVPARGCATCHSARDPHGGRFAAFACEKCHAPRMSFVLGQSPPAWKPNAFDHRKTGWALVGKHAETACRACHKAPGTSLFVPLGRGRDCVGCHEHRTVHDQKYPNADCVKCHMPSG